MQSEISFGGKLRELRREAGESQADIAKLLGQERQTYGAYENDNSFPNIDNLRKLAVHFGVTSNFLLGLSNARGRVESYSASNIHDSPFVQGSGHLEINGNMTMSREEQELVRIYRALDIREGHSLLDYAFKLEQGVKQ